MTCFSLKQHHKWGLDEINNLFPYERDMYVDLLISFLRKQKEANLE